MKNVLKKRYDHFKVAGGQCSVVTLTGLDYSKVASDHFFKLFEFEFCISISNRNMELEFRI